MLKFIKRLTATGFIFASALSNAQMIDAYVCHDCGQAEAKARAATKFIQPECEFTDLGGGPAIIGETPMFCNPTSKTVVILNPQQKLAWKYVVRASYPQQYMIQVDAQARTMSTQERETASAFFTFFDDVVAATNNGLLQLTAPQNFLGSSSHNTFTEHSNAFMNNSSSGSASCSIVQEFMGNPQDQRAVLDFVAREVVSQLQGTNPYDAHEDVDISGLGVQLGQNSVGFSIQWDTKEKPVAAIVGDNRNRLVFDLEFKGNIFGPGSGSIIVNPIIDRHFSRIDGLDFHNAFPNGVIDQSNNTTTDEFSCYRDLMTELAEEPAWGSFVGAGLESSNELTMRRDSPTGPQFCVRSVSVQTCATDHNGRSCSRTVYHFPERCL
uniref:hypothetical protein n=1 Tax=Ningiella ruwaisensis TaxID=2364274 RepID=UPI00109F2FC1|nr:hypothetical protein [Ningiella ruwaisensis]